MVQAASSPPGDARDDAWQVIIAVAHASSLSGAHKGMKDKDGKFIFSYADDSGAEVPVWDYDHYYDINVDKALYEEYRPLTHAKRKHVAPYDVLVQAHGLRWPVVQTDAGGWRETRFRFSEFDDPFVSKGAGIEFYNSTTKDSKAQIWFCPYEPASEEPAGDRPFWLSTGRVLEHWHTGSMTMRVPQLRNAMPKAYAEIHPKDAAEKGLHNGDLAKITTARGEIVLPVWINGRGAPPKGSIFLPFFDETLLVNHLTTSETCPVSKEPDYKKCAAQLEKYTGPAPAPKTVIP